MSGGSARYAARPHQVELPDGDRLIVHDDCPPEWSPGHPFVLLLHGLSGSHQSGYLVRLTTHLTARRVRVFRLDHRDCGAGVGLARQPYHAGRSDDVRHVFQFVSRLCNGSNGGIVGYSLSGNMLLKMLGEDARQEHLQSHLACAAAVNPPLDLERCSQALRKFSNRIYDQHFTRSLTRTVRARQSGQSLAGFDRAPVNLREFDAAYTAPVSGFASVEDYYSRCSGAQFVASIQQPVLILTAEDDPLIPVESFTSLPANPFVTVYISPHGGHLGYLSKSGTDPDRRWLDWRLLEWLSAHLRFAHPVT